VAIYQEKSVAVSSWGGTGAFIAEGLRRAEEEKKRKEDEEKKRQEQERRRQEEARRNSLIPKISLGNEKLDLGKQMGPLTREQAQGKPPSLAIENPYKVSRETPQIGASQTTAPTASLAPIQPVGPVMPEQSVMSATQQPAQEEKPNYNSRQPIQNPRRVQMASLGALNTVAPTLNIQSPIPSMVGKYAEPFVDSLLQGGQELYKSAAEGMLKIPILGDVIKATAPFTPVMTPVEREAIEGAAIDDADKKNMRINDAMARSQQVETPVQAVVDRYRYNLYDAPKDATDQVLQKFAPVVYGALKTLEAFGGLDEAALSAPGFLNTDKSVGEMIGIGHRANEIYQQQYDAYWNSRDEAGRPWWEIHPLQGGPDKKAVSPPDLIASIALANEEYAAALAPTAIQLQTAAPGAIAAATAYARTMGHHGIPAMAAMFDDILGNGTEATRLRDLAQARYNEALQLPSGPDKEAALFAAASYGAQAQQLAQTHPSQLFEQNANWWLALPTEMILGPTNLIDMGMDVAKLKPLARRMGKAAEVAGMSVGEAVDAITSGHGRGATWETQANDFFTNLAKGFWQTNGSQAMVDARNNFRTIASILEGFTTKEDIKKIAVKYASDPIDLLTNGIPAAELTSPGVRFMYPDADDPAIGPQLPDVVRFGPSNFGNYDAVKSFGSLAPIASLIESMPSLNGAGKFDPGQFLSELHTLLVRGAGETHGVAKLAGVPAGTVSATTNLLPDGTATIQYLGEGRTLLSESIAMGLGEANKQVKIVTKALKEGGELTGNALQSFGNAQRAILGLTTVNFGLGNLINDGISNRLIAMSDGVFSWKNPQHFLDYIQGVTGGMPAFDEIAQQVTDMTTSSRLSSQFSQGIIQGAKRIPVLGWIPAKVQELRQADDVGVRTIVYGSTHQQYMNQYGISQYKPAIDNLFKQWGWTDENAIKNASATIFDAGIRGGWNGMVQEFYKIANGTNPVSAASISPIYRDIFSTYADQFDTIIKSVTPDTVNQALADLEKLRAEASGAMANFSAQYVNSPARTAYTKLEDQSTLTQIKLSLEKTANILGEDFATGVEPYLQQIGDIQKNINANVLQVMMMSQANPNAAGHIWGLMDAIKTKREEVQTYLDQLGDTLVGNTRGLTPDEVKTAYSDFRQMQSAWYANLNHDVGILVDEARQAIVTGAPATNMGPLVSALESLGANTNRVFEINALNPGSLKLDPNKSAAIEAGRKGVDAFVTQMMMMLQANPTLTGMDHYTSAMDDAAKFLWRTIPDMERQFDEIVQRAKGMTQSGKDWDKVKAEYAQAYAAKNEAWSKYYEYAYGRYQAASALIAQAADGVVTGLPTFTPTGSWGIPAWGKNFTVTFQGFNPRNKKQVLVLAPDGKVKPMDIAHVPPDVLKQWQDLSSNLYGQLAQQVGKVGATLFQAGTGVDEIDKLIEGIRTATKNPVFDAVRKDMAAYAANPLGYGDLGSDMTNWIGKQINTISAAAAKQMASIAQANVSKNPALSLDAVRQFSTQMKPLWDNILTGANKAAEDMVSFDLIDFSKTYGPDILTGAVVPYAYWASRQGKNMLERMLFSPRFFGWAAAASRMIQSESEKDKNPQRYNNAINTGIENPLSPGENLMVQSPLPRWAPFNLRSIFQGWGDADRANQGHEILVNNMEATGFPGWQGAGGALMLGSEIMSASGLSQYPWYRDLLLMANGRGGEIALSNYGFLGQLIGYGHGIATEQYQPGMVPFYQNYKVGRDLANQQFGIDNSAQIPMAAGQAQFEGRPLDPTFAANHPEAGPEWQQAYKEQILEDFLTTFFKTITSLGVSSMDVKEPERVAAQQNYTRMGYSADNPTGSRERGQQYDEQSPNFVPGLSAAQSTYGIVGEGPMRDRLPEEESRPIDEAVNLGEYLDKRNAIYDKYKQEEVAAINAHPEWMGEKIASSSKNAFYDDNDAHTGFYERRTAEIAANDAAYPTVAGVFKPFDENSLRGANPIDVKDMALKQLIFQAREESEHLNPGDSIPDGATRAEKNAFYKAKEAYELAIATRLQELMNDPAAASKAVFGSPLLTQEPAAQQQQGSGTTTNAVNNPQAPAALGQQQATVQTNTTAGMPSVDPKNQWAYQMAEAEKANGLQPGLLQEVARNESNFRTDAKSGAGALGLLQIMPATWDEWAPKVGVTDILNPEDNIKVAAAYLGWLMQTLPEGQRDTRSVMTAYNWGIGNVLNKGVEAAPPETTAYSNTIASALDTQSVMSAPQVGGQQFIRPVQGGSELVSQGYGANVENYREWNDEHGHEGIDYGVPVGTPVQASAGGTVVYAGTGGGFENYGNYVIVDHGNGYKSYYAHLNSFDVKVGDTVEQGQTIAASGNSGRSTGPHLHFSLRKDGDTTGPYGMVNPTDFILGRAGVTAQAPATSVADSPSSAASTILTDTPLKNGEGVSVRIENPGSPASNSPVAPVAASAPATQPGGINWGVGSGSAAEVLAREDIKNDSPEKIALDKSIDDAWTHSYDRIAKTYPDHSQLFDEYRGINDELRPDWRNANPMIRALNLLVYNEVEHDEAVKLFGQGQVEKWAAIPRGENIGEAAGDYYRANPGVFETKAWIQGRPKPFDADTTFDPEKQSVYDFGADYAKAKELFGDNIWQVVNEYYATPKYVKGGDNTAWIAFKEKYPQYDQWRVWWYALMGDQQATTTGSQFGSGFSGGFNGFDPSQGEHPQYIQGVQAQRHTTPAYQGRSSGGGDWRRYLDTKLGIPNPRRK
jgi:murein DD-endopeptidase MepM/ murein hydrolase activator NlpD